MIVHSLSSEFDGASYAVTAFGRSETAGSLYPLWTVSGMTEQEAAALVAAGQKFVGKQLWKERSYATAA